MLLEAYIHLYTYNTHTDIYIYIYIYIYIARLAMKGGDQTEPQAPSHPKCSGLALVGEADSGFCSCPLDLIRSDDARPCSRLLAGNS